VIDSAKEFKQMYPDTFAILEKKTISLKNSMRLYGTNQMLKLSKSDGAGMNYWDDFLGNGDEVPRYEDRVFSTAMAFNALINTWTKKSYKNGKVILEYTEKAPINIVSVIERSARFLQSKEADNLPQDNAFFSASVKSGGVLPFYSVTNYRTSADGTTSLECDGDLFTGFSVVFGVRGLMDEKEYMEREQAGCFNTKTMNPDVDYNR
jgi:hypothetical protein